MEASPDGWTQASPAMETADSHNVLQRKLNERYKVLLWIMTANLSLNLAWQMGELMPPVLVFVFWTSSEFFVLGWWYWLFIYRVPDSNGSGNIMRGVLWGFAAVLNVIFPLQKMKRFPPELAMLVYLKSGFVIIGGFYGLFLSRVARRPDPIHPR